MEFIESEDAKKIALLRKVRLMALGTLQRARSAAIPPRWLRISRDAFKALLNPDYHKENSINEITAIIYDNKPQLVRLPYILIDGGDVDERTAAGCAILFRIIFYQRRGYFINCNEMVHRLQGFDKSADVSRNSLASELKQHDALFINEFSPILFKGWMQEGEFFEEIIADRANNLRPTIISFTKSISKIEQVTDLSCGQHIAKLSGIETLDPNPSESCLRIRVGVTA